MYEIDMSSTHLRRLDELHPLCSRVVSCLEHIDSRLIVISEEDHIIRELGILEIVASCLDLVQFTILARCHRCIEGILHDDDIVRESIADLRRYGSEHYLSVSWHR